MKLDSPRQDIEKVKDKIIVKDCTPHEIPGSRKLAIGITEAGYRYNGTFRQTYN
jgi:hypothetical protein